MVLLERSKTVQDYKIADADKYTLGMAINNAAVIVAGTKKNWDDTEMKALISRLFALYKEIRQETLGY